MSQAKVVERIETHIIGSLTFIRKSRCLKDNVGKKYGVETRRATDDNILRGMRFAC